MKAHSDWTINGKRYPKGSELPWYYIYPFFGVHMLAFGASGFFMAYGDNVADLMFLYIHGGFAIFVYLVFYLALFGLDQVRWMFINAGLGLFGIYAQIDLILALFGKRAADFPPSVHFIPFLYYILYTFLLHQAILDLFKARDDEDRRRMVNFFYIFLSLLAYGALFLIGRRSGI